MSECHYSILVDRVPDHPYKAGLLVQSLLQFGEADADQIHVHYTPSVEQSSVEHFASIGCRTRRVQPYLDGKYCNKINQLKSLTQHDDLPETGVWLLDIDVFVLAPLEVNSPEAVWGKIVDAQNPPLDSLVDIFDTAALKHPEICQSDWRVGSTFRTNFNGGVLYIPTPSLHAMDETWRKWAEFLYARQELIATPQHRIHIDQISFSLALADLQLEARNLPANFNYPAHSTIIPSSLDAHKPIKALHYHAELDRFGFIRIPPNSDAGLRDSISIANQAIEGFDLSELFEEKKSGDAKAFADHRRSDAKWSFDHIDERLKQFDPNKKLIIHGGTPKTGTSALQRYCGSQRGRLAEKGIWYPEPSNTPEPKHQQLVAALQKEAPEPLLDWLFSVFETCPKHCHKVFLTSEGIYNHWWDHSAVALYALSKFIAYFQSECWFVFRDPVEFATSLYAQYLKNPQIGGPMADIYGCNRTAAEMFENDWFAAHFDYLEFYYSYCELMGAETLKLFPYNQQVAELLIEKLIGEKPVSVPQRNTSLGATSIEALKLINGLSLNVEEKAKAVGLLKQLDKLLRRHDKNLELTEAEKALIHSRTRHTWDLFKSNLS